VCIETTKEDAAAAASPLVAPTLPPLTTTTSATLSALAGISQALAASTLSRLVSGYQDRSGSGYGPALRNEAGCLLAQKGSNRAVRFSRAAHVIDEAHC